MNSNANEQRQVISHRFCFSFFRPDIGTSQTLWISVSLGNWNKCVIYICSFVLTVTPIIFNRWRITPIGLGFPEILRLEGKCLIAYKTDGCWFDMKSKRKKRDSRGCARKSVLANKFNFLINEELIDFSSLSFLIQNCHAVSANISVL